jgi:hypothetical protein
MEMPEAKILNRFINKKIKLLNFLTEKTIRQNNNENNDDMFLKAVVIKEKFKFEKFDTGDSIESYEFPDTPKN